MFRPRLVMKDPGKNLPRRIVPDMLGVSAFQLCDPFALRILPKADDLSLAQCQSSFAPLTTVRDGSAWTVRTPTSTSSPPTMVDSATVSPSRTTAERSVTNGSR